MGTGPYDWLRERMKEEQEPGTARQRIGRYVVLDVAGSGGMGRVLRAEDTSLGRIVALKIQETGPAERWEREARAMARLSHPNVAAVYDVGEADGQRFLAMEFVEGDPLGTAWKEWTLPRRVEAVRRVAAGVAALHDHGVLHRDLKPANVMVTHAGGVKIVDFGLARIEGDVSLTREGSLMGSPAYMAPEQVRAGKPTAATDVYALGVLLYEALTGRPPFLAETAAEIYQQILNERPVPPSQRAQGVPPPLERACLQALDKDPAYRYASAGAFGADLQRWIDGTEMLGSGPVSAWRRVAARPLVWLSTALALALIAGVGFWWRSDRGWRADVLAGRAAASYSAGDYRGAAEAVEEALRLAPDHAGARTWRTRLRLRDYHERRGLPQPIVSRGAVGIAPPAPETPALRVLREELQREDPTPFLTGALALADGRAAEALDAFARAGDDVEVVRFRAQCLYLLGRFDEALAAVAPVLSRDPVGALPLHASILAAIAMKSPEPERWFRQAEESASALKVAGDGPGSRLLLGRIHAEWAAADHRRGLDPAARVAAALGAVEGLETPEAMLVRGDALLVSAESASARGRVAPAKPAAFVTAIEAYDAAIRLRPSLALAWLRRASARRLLRSFLANFGREDTAGPRAILDDLLEAVRLSGHPEARIALAQAEGELDRAAAAADPDRAIDATVREVDAVRAVLKEAPAFASGWQALAESLIALVEWRRSRGQKMREDILAAIDAADRAAALDPGYAQPLLQRATARRHLAYEDNSHEPFAQARADIDAAMAISRHLGIRFARFTVLREEGHFVRERNSDPMPMWTDAIRHISDALDACPGHPQILYWRAMAHRDVGTYLAARHGDARPALEAAIADLEACTAANPAHVDAWRIRSMVHLRLGQLARDAKADPTEEYRRGLSAIARAFDIDSDLPLRLGQYQLARGNLLLALGDYETSRGRDGSPSYREAIEAMDIALKINSRYADYYRVRGRARAGLKRYDEALADYDFILKEFAHFPLVSTWKQERAAIEAAKGK